MKTYQTVQGDMWDSIAKKVYGCEWAMEKLMKANPEYMNVAVFGAGVEILLPQIELEKEQRSSVPPWRR